MGFARIPSLRIAVAKYFIAGTSDEMISLGITYAIPEMIAIRNVCFHRRVTPHATENGRTVSRARIPRTTEDVNTGTERLRSALSETPIAAREKASVK
jgi:hypothetical protein